MNKRLLLASVLLASLAAAKTGAPVEELQPLDQAMNGLIRRWQLPGGSLAVVKDGRLVYARGFGFADRANGQPVQPDSLFRICSLSKPVTATAVLALVEAGMLSLDAAVLSMLGPELAPPRRVTDSRWHKITVRHLLYHAGGWDANRTFDPMDLTAQDIRELGGTFPLSFGQIFAYMLAQPLQFEPGTRAAYSNFGYALLGLVIERAAGMPYEKYVHERIWNRIGLVRPFLGGGPVTARRLGEVEYHDYPGAPLGEAVYPGVGPQVALPDGTVFVEPLAAAGGWVASAPDLVRYLDALNTSEALLKQSSRQAMLTPPSFASPSAGPQQGMGWIVLPNGDQYVLIGEGQASGSYALACWSNAARTGWAALFNSSPPNERVVDLFPDALNTFARALISVDCWPDRDLFASYYPQGAPRIADAGVANAASYLHSRIAPGELVSLYGDHLGPREGVQAALEAPSSGSMELGGVSVWFDGNPARLLYASTERINVLAPARLARGGKVSIEVAYRGRKSAPHTAELGRSAPGLFTVSGNGRGCVAALNSDGTPNSEHTPAPRRSTISLFGTGLGLLERGTPQGKPGEQSCHFPAPGIQVRIDGVDSMVLDVCHPAGMMAGVWQLNVRVPEGVSSGMRPIQVEADGNPGRETVYVQIQ